jgi:hypothetical protein
VLRYGYSSLLMRCAAAGTCAQLYSVQELMPSAGQAGITLIIEMTQGWGFQLKVCEAIVDFPKQPTVLLVHCKKLQVVLLLPLLELHFWTLIFV